MALLKGTNETTAPQETARQGGVLCGSLPFLPLYPFHPSAYLVAYLFKPPEISALGLLLLKPENV